MIPVFEPELGEDEALAVAEAVRRGEISGSFGETIPAFEREFAEYVGAEHAVAVTSGTTALHLALAALEIGQGDEVLMSASTNIATALAAYHLGAVPVPVDSEAETGNLDLALVPELVTERTKAIIPVHLFGHPVDMDRLDELADDHGLIVVEDCAESHGATVRGRMTGSFGALACFSLYANKIVTTGEGGIITTSDGALAEKLRLLRNLAFEHPRFVHSYPGFNYRMTGMQAALGRVQLAKIESVIAEKRRVAHTYDELLADVPGLRGPGEADWARNVYWMYVVEVGAEFPLTRDELRERLLAEGIDTRTHFCPMNLQPVLCRSPGFRAVPCPVAERLWETGMYLPSSPSLDRATIERVVGTIERIADRA